MDEAVKLFKNGPIEEAAKLFMDNWKSSDIRVENCVAVLKAIYFRANKSSSLTVRETSLICDVVLSCGKTLRKQSSYEEFIKFAVYFYHIIIFLLNKFRKPDQALIISEDFYSLIVYSKWWQSVDKKTLLEDNNFFKIVRNLQCQIWQNAQAANDTSLGLRVLSFKMMLVLTNGRCSLISKTVKDNLQVINREFSSQEDTSFFVSKVTKVFSDLNASHANDCASKEKLAEFLTVLIESFTSFGQLWKLSDVLNNFLKTTVTFNAPLSDCSSCGISRTKKKLLNVLMELMFASFKSHLGPLQTYFLDETAAKSLRNRIDYVKKYKTLLNVDEIVDDALILRVLLLVKNAIPRWENKCIVENLRVFNDVVEFVFRTLRCFSKSPLKNDFQAHAATIFRSYLTLVSQTIKNPGKYPKELETSLNILSYGLITLFKMDKKHISLVSVIYVIGNKLFKEKPSLSAWYYKYLCDMVHHFIDRYSIQELSLNSKETETYYFECCCRVQYCYEIEKEYEKALDVCAKNAFYFGLHLPQQVFEMWIRIKKLLFHDKVINPSLEYRTIVDQLELCKDIFVAKETLKKLLTLELRSYSTKPAAFYQVYSNYAAVKLVSLPEASDVEKAVATLALCVSPHSRGKPENWNFEEKCENAIEILEKAENLDDSLKVRLAIGYYCLWRIRNETLSSEIRKEELERRDKIKKTPVKPKGDEEIPDRCDIESAYKHFNIVTESHVLKPLIKFNLILCDVLNRDRINWTNDVEIYYQNIIMEFSSSVADVFSGATMISEAIDALRCLLKISDILDKKSYWIEGVLKLMDLMIDRGMSVAALSLSAEVEKKISSVNFEYDTTFVENFLLLLKAEAYLDTFQLKKGITFLSKVLSRIFKLSEMDSSAPFWVILQTKAFLTLFKYKKASPIASIAPSTCYVNEREYLALSPTVVLLKALEIIHLSKGTDLCGYTYDPNNLHLCYRQYLKNLYLETTLELGKHFVDIGCSREARFYLQDCLVYSKLRLRTMVGANALLQLAFLDILCDQKFDCHVKMEGLFYMFTYNRVEPLNICVNVDASPSIAIDETTFVLNSINQLNNEMIDFEDDIFLNDCHKMKLKKMKLPASFHHPKLCDCDNCKYSELEEIYLNGLRINAKTLILEGKYSEALSILRVVKTHFQKLSNKEHAVLDVMLTKIASLVKELSITEVKSPSIRSVKLNLNIQDDLAECYSALKHFKLAEDSLKSAVKIVNDVKERGIFLPIIESKIFYRQALVTLHHNCHLQRNMSIDDCFKRTMKVPLRKLHSVCVPCPLTPLMPHAPKSKCPQNAPKKLQSFLSKISATPNESEFTAPIAPVKKSRNDINSNASQEVKTTKSQILKPKNELIHKKQTPIVISSSESNISGDELEKITQTLKKIKIKGAKASKERKALISSDSSSVSPVKKSSSSQSSSNAGRAASPPRRFFKGRGKEASTKKENIAPVRKTKPKRKTKALTKSSDSSSSDEFDFPKRDSQKTQPSTRVTRYGRNIKEVLRADETSPVNNENLAPSVVNSGQNNTQNERSSGFTVFQDNCLDYQVPHQKISAAVMNTLETLLSKALTVTRHYPDCVLYGEINLLLTLVYYEAKKYLRASHIVSKSVCATLHQVWINTLQLTRQSNPSEVNLSQIAKEETLFHELFQSEEKLAPSLEFLPSDWTVVQINLLTTTPLLYNSEIDPSLSLIVTRFQKNKDPIISIIKVTDEQFRFSFWRNIKSLFVQNDDSLKKGLATEWWDKRFKLDQSLQNLCTEIETHWLRFYKCFVVGNFVSNAKSHQVKQSCKKFLRDCKNKGINCVLPDLLEVLMAAGSVVTREECDEAVIELFEISNAETHHELSDLLYKQLQAIGTDNRHPIFLILDKHLHFIPWESMPILRNASVFRIPSLLSLKTQLKSYETDPRCLLNRGMNALVGFAIVNPDGSIKKSADTVTPFVQSAGWGNIISTNPTPSEMITAVTDYDIYFYCGHGAGKVFFSGQLIEQKNCRASAVLMGCSSGKLRQSGCLEPMGTALQYWLGGCPIVIGNLWDVTDVDIDKFTLEFFKNWLYKSESDEDLPTSVKIGQAMLKGRNVCKLKYMIGSAPVIYGVPVNISNYL